MREHTPTYRNPDEEFGAIDLLISHKNELLLSKEQIKVIKAKLIKDSAIDEDNGYLVVNHVVRHKAMKCLLDFAMALDLTKDEKEKIQTALLLDCQLCEEIG